MKRIKSFLFGASCAVASLPALVFGQEQQAITLGNSVQQLVNPQDVQTQLTANLGNWLIVGIGIGISVFIVYLGWRLLKRFTRG